MENPSQIHHGHDHEHHHEQKHDGEHDQQHHQGHEHQHHHAHDHLHGVGDSDGFWVGKDGKRYHSHDGLAPHTHESLDSPGYFTRRAKRLANRDFKERAFTVGIGGPENSVNASIMHCIEGQVQHCCGVKPKTPLKKHGEIPFQISSCYTSTMESFKHRELCRVTHHSQVTNDIFTREDGEFLVKHGALPPERIMAVETGGCPHAAIREDISINLGPLEELSMKFSTDILLCESGGGIGHTPPRESGGDNLAANFSRELADYIIYIIDVAGGDKIPRKGGPGITQADLLVINKTDLAEAVGANLKVMEQDAMRMRDGGPFVFTQVKHGVGVQEIIQHVLGVWEEATGKKML